MMTEYRWRSRPERWKRRDARRRGARLFGRRRRCGTIIIIIDSFIAMMYVVPM
jgi:archaellum biogenesis ATPase FlaH